MNRLHVWALLAMFAIGCYNTPADEPQTNTHGDAAVIADARWSAADAFSGTTSPATDDPVQQVAQGGTGTATCEASYIGFILKYYGGIQASYAQHLVAHEFGRYAQYAPEDCDVPSIPIQFELDQGRFPDPSVAPHTRETNRAHIGGINCVERYSTALLAHREDLGVVFFEPAQIPQNTTLYGEDWVRYDRTDWAIPSSESCLCSNQQYQVHSAIVMRRISTLVRAEMQRSDSSYEYLFSCPGGSTVSRPSTWTTGTEYALGAYVICKGESPDFMKAHRVAYTPLSAFINLSAVPYYPGYARELQQDFGVLVGATTVDPLYINSARHWP